MLLCRSLISAVLILCAEQARAISFDCVPPVFPSRQVSQEEQRRIEQQVRAWKACYAAFSATHRNIDATRQDHEVANELVKWSASIRAQSAPNGQRAPAEAVDKRKVEESMLRQAAQQPVVYSRDRR